MYAGFKKDDNFSNKDQITDAIGFVDGLEDVVDDNENDINLMETTIADVDYAPQINARYGSCIPGCVLLNNCGSLLTRKEYKASGTTKTNNFLQRIVSCAPGKNIPLMYPESMLFPSIFWHSDHEGNIVGALPSGMLTNKSHLSENGFASIEDHIKCRITNPSLLTSTDPRYLMYSLDAMANLALTTDDS